MQLNSFPSNIIVGASVEQGQFLGMTGSSGMSREPHLHFSIREGNKNSFWSASPKDNDPGDITYKYDGYKDDNVKTS